MENEVVVKRNYYEKQIKKIRGSRISMVIALLAESIILLIHAPGFLGSKWIEKSLTVFRDFLVSILWPARPGDMATYKGTVYQICTWFQELPFFDLLVWTAILAVPVLLVLSYIRIWILKCRISFLERPPREKKPIVLPRREKEESEPRVSVVNRWESGVFASAAAEANEYCRKVQERCDNPFSKEPGVRVQRMSGEVGLGERRDYVIPWDDNGMIDLSPILRRASYLVLERGEVYLYSQGVRCNVPLERYVPFLCTAGTDPRTITVCAITWLGG